MAQSDDARLAGVLAEVVTDGDTKSLFRRLLQESLHELIEERLIGGTCPYIHHFMGLLPVTRLCGGRAAMPAPMRCADAWPGHTDRCASALLAGSRAALVAG